MPQRAAYVPKHRAPTEPSPRRAAPRRAVRTTLLSSVAVAATAAAVSGGLLHEPGAFSSAASSPRPPATAEVAPLTQEQLAERRSDVVSRSADRRRATDPVKAAALRESDGPAMARTERLTPSDPRDIARALLPQFGFSADQFACLDDLYNGESAWRVDADNPTSSAYGIPQALPGEKIASAGADWATNPETQIRWGLGYIRASYGTPCAANEFKLSHNWY